MTRSTTQQEELWAGSFGDEYIGRNRTAALFVSNLSLFAHVMRKTEGVSSVLEIGANIGLNLVAISRLLPDTSISAVEINYKAVQELAFRLPQAEVFHQSVLDFFPRRTWDFVFTKGLLIHISPDKLPSVYETIYRCSDRYILLCEYYSSRPRAIDYRGYSNLLFARDFAGEMMDIYSDLRLIGYGFVYHRDSRFPQDDMTWFLMEKA
jgi:pseudaminic acid biosynthesis-associated methylase